MSAPLRVFHEVHVDDFALETHKDPATYRASKALVEAIVQTAEAAGVRLALRFRWPFPEAAWQVEGAANPLPDWESRGHEIGTHAHRTGVARAQRAIDTCGVRHNLAVVPGIIDGHRGLAASTLRGALGRGFEWCTDQVQHGVFPYAGRTPWRPDPSLRGPGHGELVFVDVSVDPFQWGLLERRAGQVHQTHGLRDVHFARLWQALEVWLAAPPVHPVQHFGYVFHEHQHVRGGPGGDMDPKSLAAWARFLTRLDSAPVQSVTPGEIVAAWRALEPTAGGPAAPVAGTAFQDTRTRVRSRVHRAGLGRVAGGLVQRAADGRRDAARKVRSRRARRVSAEATEHRVPGPRGPLRALRFGPPRAAMTAVVSMAGVDGGCTSLLDPLGLDPARLCEAVSGLVLWCYDRSGTGGAPPLASVEPGQVEHVQDARLVFEYARKAGGDTGPTGWLCFSAGCVAPLMALPGVSPAFFIDAEGPADRWSLVPAAPPHAGMRDAAAGLRARPRTDPSWAAIEPCRTLARLDAPYMRLQAAHDHQHGPMVLHAGVMLRAARRPWLNGAPWSPAVPLEGPTGVWAGTLRESAGLASSAIARFLASGLRTGPDAE